MKKLSKRMRISQGRVLKATHCSIGTQKIPLHELMDPLQERGSIKFFRS
jgi:hypothetical protein